MSSDEKVSSFYAAKNQLAVGLTRGRQLQEFITLKPIVVEGLDKVQRHRAHLRYNYNTIMYTITIAEGDPGRVRLHPGKTY